MNIPNPFKYLYYPIDFIKNLIKKEPKPVVQKVKPTDKVQEKATPNLPSKYVWVLDNGHGKDTPGKRYEYSYFTFYEYQFNRIIVKLIAKKLKYLNIDYVILTNEERDIGINARVTRTYSIQKTKSKDCILLSVHANAQGLGSEFGKATGIETLYYTKSDRSKYFANVFQSFLVHELLELPEFYDRGIKGRSNLGLLKNSNMPAILTENGFYTNKAQAEDMISIKVQDKIADAHVKAIQFFENF